MPVAAVPAPLGVWDIFFRMLCAMAVGTVIGTEREYSHRPAGMRTHILVALGSCAVMLTSQLLFTQYSAYGALPDPARLPAQVITGVGFLGAGTILREGPTVRGLTTAASLWSVACLGVAAGAGYYAIALVGMVFIFITLTFFEFLQRRLVNEGSSIVRYQLETTDVVSALEALNKHAKHQDAVIYDMKTERNSDGSFVVLFRADIRGLHSQRRRQRFFAALTAEDSVRSINLSGRSGDPIE